MALHKSGAASGGAPQETALWTNPSPTSSTSALRVDLSGSINDYDYIKISFRTSTTKSTIRSAIYTSEDFKNFTGTSTSNDGLISYGASPVATYDSYTNCYVRYIKYETTTVFFSNATLIGSTTSRPGLLIPQSIVGIKY